MRGRTQAQVYPLHRQRRWNGVESVGSLGRQGSGALLIRRPSMTKRRRGDPIPGPKWSEHVPFPRLSLLLSGCVVLLRDDVVCHRRSLLWFSAGLFCCGEMKKIKIKSGNSLRGKALPGRVNVFGWLEFYLSAPLSSPAFAHDFRINMIWVT